MQIGQRRVSRRSIVRGMGLTIAAAASGLASPAIVRAAGATKIGLLSPLSGPLAFVGQTNHNCLTLALEEMNAAGGLLGQKVEMVVEDSQMSTKVTVDKARKLIASDDVVAIIGSVLPSEREAILQVAAPAKRLVIHPNFDEGRCHPNLLTTGLASNQRVEPMIAWLAKNVGKRVYILASDLGSTRNVFVPQVKANLAKVGGTLVDVQYFPFGTRDFGPALQQVKQANPDIVWHSIGDDPITFVKQYKSFGMKPQLVTEITHESIAAATEGDSVGDIGVSSYFMSLRNPANQRFLDSYTKEFADFSPLRVGEKVVMLPHGESTYVGAKVFAEAARIAGSLDFDKLKAALGKVALDLPRGPVTVDAAASHLLCKSLIGRCQADSGFEILAELGPVPPACS